VARDVLAQWQRTGDGPAQNFLAGWQSSAIVVAIDLAAVTPGGPLLGVWASVHTRGAAASGDKPPVLGPQIERVGRPLIANALIGLVASDEASERGKEQYNRATPSEGARFVEEFERSLALYDGYDGACGNQWLAGRNAAPARRYHTLAALLADDRLWLDSRVARCERYLGIEQAYLASRDEPRAPSPPFADCGGRTLTVDANNAFRSLIVLGAPTGAGDGVHADDRATSTSFPFVAAP